MRRVLILGCVFALFGIAASAAERGPVEDQFVTIRDFRLHNGTVMPEVKIAYETYGKLAPPN
jgi:homoserine acetyltransferase